MKHLIWLTVTCVILGLGQVQAGEFYDFDTAEQEAKFQQLTRELRCPKCQNQSIADSDAPLAMDMRQRVYQLIMEGQSREEIIEFMKVRYGDFVHYRPPLNASTVVLWFSPVLVILIGALAIFLNVRANRRKQEDLTPAEQERLNQVLRKEQDK